MNTQLSTAPRMYDTLHLWATSQRDAGNLDGAALAAQSMVREAGSVDQLRAACRLLAQLHRRRGDLPAARTAIAHWAENCRERVEANPTTEHRVELLSALDELAELAREDQDHGTVLECHGYRGRMGILQELAQEYNEPVALLTEQCYSLRRAATAAREMGSLQEARSLFWDRLAVARITFAGNPGDPQLTALVATALADLGALLISMGDRRAGEVLREELALRTWLNSTAEPDAAAKLQLAQCHLAMTNVGLDTGEHQRIATGLLSELHAQGQLDLAGRLLLSSLRTA